MSHPLRGTMGMVITITGNIMDILKVWLVKFFTLSFLYSFGLQPGLIMTISCSHKSEFLLTCPSNDQTFSMLPLFVPKMHPLQCLGQVHRPFPPQR